MGGCGWYEGAGWWPSWRGAVRERVHAAIANRFSRSAGSSWNPTRPPVHAGTPPETPPGIDAVDEMVETSSEHLDCFRFLELRSERKECFGGVEREEERNK